MRQVKKRGGDKKLGAKHVVTAQLHLCSVSTGNKGCSLKDRSTQCVGGGMQAKARGEEGGRKRS